MASWSPDPAGTGPLIAGFRGGGFWIEGKIYPAVLLTPTRATLWTPPPIEALGEADLQPLLGEPLPFEFLVIGSGTALRRPARALIRAIEDQGIGVVIMDSRAAARAWGVLRAEDRWIGAASYPLT